MKTQPTSYKEPDERGDFRRRIMNKIKFLKPHQKVVKRFVLDNQYWRKA